MLLTYLYIWCILCILNFLMRVILNKYLNPYIQMFCVFMIETNNIKMTKVTQCASVHDESSCFSFPTSLLVIRSNLLLSPDGISRGWLLMPNIKCETPSLSCMNQRWTQYGCKRTRSKMERKRTPGSPKVLLSWWNKWTEGVVHKLLLLHECLKSQS